jgi:predicted nucleotidyltransferase
MPNREMTIIVHNRCRLEYVNALFLPILHDAINAYAEFLSEILMDVRLMGSVARGNAIPGQSDIDFVGITKCNATVNQRDAISRMACMLTERYGCARKVDLEIETFGEIDPARVFIFKTDSISIHGNSLYSDDNVEITNTLLAKQNTPAIAPILTTYAKAVQDASDPKRIEQYSIWTGKDLLKCFRKYLILKYGIYESSIHSIYEQLITHFSQGTTLFKKLYELYSAPTVDKDMIMRIQEEASVLWERMEEENGTNSQIDHI